MRSIIAAVAVALLTALLAMQAAPVSAQKHGGGAKDTRQTEAEAEAKMKSRQGKEIDSGYKSAIDRLPDQKLDPWRNLR